VSRSASRCHQFPMVAQAVLLGGMYASGSRTISISPRQARPQQRRAGREGSGHHRDPGRPRRPRRRGARDSRLQAAAINAVPQKRLELSAWFDQMRSSRCRAAAWPAKALRERTAAIAVNKNGQGGFDKSFLLACLVLWRRQHSLSKACRHRVRFRWGFPKLPRA